MTDNDWMKLSIDERNALLDAIRDDEVAFAAWQDRRIDELEYQL